jgi:hypothetical protein
MLQLYLIRKTSAFPQDVQAATCFSLFLEGCRTLVTCDCPWFHATYGVFVLTGLVTLKATIPKPCLGFITANTSKRVQWVTCPRSHRYLDLVCLCTPRGMPDSSSGGNPTLECAVQGHEATSYFQAAAYRVWKASSACQAITLKLGLSRCVVCSTEKPRTERVQTSCSLSFFSMQSFDECAPANQMTFATLACCFVRRS